MVVFKLLICCVALSMSILGVIFLCFTLYEFRLEQKNIDAFDGMYQKFLLEHPEVKDNENSK